MNGHYEIGEVVLSHWKLVRELGEGGYGKVYEAHRDERGFTYKSAIKIITIPPTGDDDRPAGKRITPRILKETMENPGNLTGGEPDSKAARYRGLVDTIAQECEILYRLQNSEVIVGYADHEIIPHSDQAGCDALIRMELLTPLTQTDMRNMSRRDVIQLGIDICKALELCERKNIVHRDIKPENIFVSEPEQFAAGPKRFKLGDFGIARTIEGLTGAAKAEAVSTGAKETCGEEPWHEATDIYTLGTVLYGLLNEGVPPYPRQFTSGGEKAGGRDREGEPLPAPINADKRLAAVVLKACASEPQERYAHPAMMREDLEALLRAPEPERWGFFARWKAFPTKTKIGGLAAAAAVLALAVGIAVHFSGGNDGTGGTDVTRGACGTDGTVTVTPIQEDDTSVFMLGGLAFSRQDEEIAAKEAGLTDEDLSAFAEGTACTALDLSGNEIASIRALSGQTQLKSLNLSNNRIKDIAGIEALTELETLNLSGNQITDISALAELPDTLRSLNLSGNGLADISALSRFTSLTSLSVRDNEISDVSALLELQGLEKLWIGTNKISREDAARVVAALPNCEVKTGYTLTASLTIEAPAGKIRVGDKVQLRLSATPEKIPGAIEKGTLKPVWHSSDEDIATVDGKGVVTAKKKGSVTISASLDGLTAERKITIEKKQTTHSSSSTTPAKPAITLNVGSSKTVNSGVVFTIKVTSPACNVISFASDNRSVATVTSKGEVTTGAQGVATITVTTDVGTVTCKVTVNPGP